MPREAASTTGVVNAVTRPSLTEVILATAVCTAGTLTSAKYFAPGDQLAAWRDAVAQSTRRLMAEQLLVAQAEGLRAKPAFGALTPQGLKLIVEPPGSGLRLTVSPTPTSVGAHQYVFYDVVIRDGATPLGTLSLSTLRRTGASPDLPIGL